MGRCSDYPASGKTTFTGLHVNNFPPTSWSKNVLQNDGCGEAVGVPKISTVALSY